MTETLLISLIAVQVFGVDANIMSLAGIAIAIGTMVSFLPVFFLTGRDHRLFSPLAWTKTYALAASLIVAVSVEGRERYPIQICHQRNDREEIDELHKVSVVAPSREVVPLERLANASELCLIGTMVTGRPRLPLSMLFPIVRSVPSKGVVSIKQELVYA